MKVIKKLGHRQDFDINKVKIALQKTAVSIDQKFTENDWKELKPRILSRLELIIKGRDEIFFWEIDEAVMDSLLRSRFKDVAKEYILSRSNNIKDNLNDLGLSPVAIDLLKTRYLKKDDEDKPIETAKEMMCRVSTSIASVEKTSELREEYSQKFSNMLCNLDFLPSSPCLVSAGTNKFGTYMSCLTGDSIIPTTNGDKTMKELYDESINNFYVFSCENEKLKIGKADRVIKTRENADVYKLELDSGRSIKTTLDHLFMMRNGEYKKLSELQTGDSLMPFNCFYAKKKNGKKTYRYVFENISAKNIKEAKPAYSLVFKEVNGRKPLSGNYIHHRDFCQQNDNPENLIEMTKEEHMNLHFSVCSHMKNEKYKKLFSDRMKGNKIAVGVKRNGKFKERMRKNNPMFIKEVRDKVTKSKIELFKQNIIKKTCPICNKEFESRKHKNRIYCSIECKGYASRGNKNWMNRKTRNPYYNHKIISIQYYGKEDVYDIHSVEKYHNFAAEGIFVHNCYAFEIQDSLDSIFDVLHDAAKVFQMGGGVGISVSKLREKGSRIKTSMGRSSGPVSFLHQYDVMVKRISQGGFRRGALLALMTYNHPDIEEFIHCKRDIDALNNMNISVLADDDFFKAIKENKDINLVSPKTNKVVKKIPSSLLLESIATNIWETGEPGLLFYDRINEDNPTPHLGDLRVCNPCAEATLLSGEACVLGSINLVKHINEGEIDWDKLANTTKLAIRFLDNMIDASPQPNMDIDFAVKKTRKVGLGIMGFADMLILLGIKYSSKGAVDTANKIMSFINDVASKYSEELGKEKGLYNAYKDGCRKRRNSIVTTIAPTGSLSLIAGVSSGIEPNFAKEYTRKIDGKVVTITHRLQKDPNFETFNDIPVQQHLKILSEFQKNVENAVSKTCNVPEDTTVNDIKELINTAHEMGVKGITIFRDKCKRPPLINCEDCKI